MIRIQLPSVVIALAVSFSLSARAQEPSSQAAPSQPPAESQAAPTSPPPPSESAPATPAAPAVPETPTAPPAPPPVPAPSTPRAFLDQFLTFDEASGKVFMGRKRRELSREEFFQTLGKPDLIAQSQAAANRRLIFAVSAGVVAVAGIVTAVAVWSNLPDLNGGVCVSDVHIYNEVCVPEYKSRQVLGGVALGGGLALGALLATFAYWSNPDLLSPDEKRAAISQHNAALLKRLRGEQPAAFQLRLTPYATAQGAGLVTTLTF